MGIQIWCDGLRWWWSRRNRIRFYCSRLFHGSRPPTRTHDAQLPPSQRFAHPSRYRLSLVRLAGIQRWFLLRCQPACHHGLLEHQPDCCFRCHYLGSARLASGSQVVHGRMVFRHHLRFGRGDSSFRFHHPLGQRGPGYRDRHRMQLLDQDQVLDPH